MDSEFRNIMTAVIEGRIVDPIRIREIIADARTAVAAKDGVLDEMKTLLYQAEEVFVTGEPLKATITE